MQIPKGPTGFPTVSTTQLRTYGVGGFRLLEQEEAKGCPRQYKAKYVERRVPDQGKVYALAYGSFFHDVLFRMEEDGLTPDEALERCFPVDLGPEAWHEAKADLEAYLNRGASPMDRYGTVAVETELDAELYVDEDFGPIHFRGFIDWLGIDLDLPQVLHVVDYKTNRNPPSTEDVRGDVQLKGYHWLAQQHADRWGARQVVVHLDAVKWREIEVRFSAAEIEDWHSWAVAVVRKILRDEEAKPQTNPGCSWCPVKDDCPAFLGLPAQAVDLAAGLKGIQEDGARLAWRDAANKVRLLLEKSVKEIDDGFAARAQAEGRLRVDDTEWTLEPDWKTQIDLRSLHRAMGPRFYDVVSTSKTKIEAATSDWDTVGVAAVSECIERSPAGSKVVKRKVTKQ